MNINIKGEVYSYYITPRYNTVTASISYKSPTYDLDMHVVSREFTPFWRKPIEEDYVRAKLWAENELYLIKQANSDDALITTTKPVQSDRLSRLFFSRTKSMYEKEK